MYGTHLCLVFSFDLIFTRAFWLFFLLFVCAHVCSAIKELQDVRRTFYLWKYFYDGCILVYSLISFITKESIILINNTSNQRLNKIERQNYSLQCSLDLKQCLQSYNQHLRSRYCVHFPVYILKSLRNCVTNWIFQNWALPV